MKARWWLVVAIGGVVSACSTTTVGDGGGSSCAGPTDCADGFRCDRNRCVAEGLVPADEDDAGAIPFDAGLAHIMDADVSIDASSDDHSDDGAIDPEGDAGWRVDAAPTDAGRPPCSTCPAAQQCCSDVCVDREVPIGSDGRANSSFLNCGGCGLACDEERASACVNAWGSMVCSCGYQAACAPNEVCVWRTGRFQCVDTDSDPENCGSFGHACNPGEQCLGGDCQCGTGSSCGVGHQCCDGQCVDTATSPEHCGACGRSCGILGDRCVAGTCRCGPHSRCAPAGLTSLGELCCAETCLDIDDGNCGGCGHSCAEDRHCGINPLEGEYCCTEAVSGLCFSLPVL